jgi:hypothetical protein
VPETVRIDLSHVPETLGALVPVSTSVSGDDNNNVNKSLLTTVGPPASVISLVLETDASRWRCFKKKLFLSSSLTKRPNRLDQPKHAILAEPNICR